MDAYWQKEKAEQIASDLSGVREVRNLLTVTPSAGSEDGEIVNEIMAAFERTYSIDPSRIAVQAKNGHVILSGTVPTWDMFIDVDEIFSGYVF